MPPRLKVFFDGGCRPNPGAMEMAVVAGGKTYLARDLGQGTSTDAEWLALIHALRIARSLGAADFVMLGDAAHVVAAANGAVTCRGASARHLADFRALAGVDRTHVRRVKRAQNLAGIALAKLHPR